MQPEHFELADIFRKVRLHFEPAAFEKGLALRIRGGKHVALADPLLVERIVRNLVSNAIRYTQDGSVLLSCRRRGERLLLQVWDTGPGIRADERARIFEEFYQVPGVAVVTVEQKKGLGLGLAIVKRLCASDGGAARRCARRKAAARSSPSSCRSARRPRTTARSIPGKGPIGITLDGRVIVIVEDEPAVREGLEVLLTGWGATIVSLASVGAARAWAEGADPAAPPALVIADYRLDNGETGVAAIDLVRERFGKGVPAIVVTGSSMTGHDKEALEHDFHLLIKPVLPNKLRAMIAFKLGRR